MALTDALNQLRLPSLGGSFAAGLLADWRGQALGCMPRRIRRWLAARRPALVIVPHGDEAQMLRQIVDEREAVGIVDRRNGGDLAGAIDSAKSQWREVVLELPQDAVLIRNTVLPAQVRDNLGSVMAYELDRLTPFQRDDVYFDARVRGSLARGAKIDVELAACRRDLAVGWLEQLRTVGIPASRLSWVGAWPGANLLPPSERPRPRRLEAVLVGALVLLMLLLLGAAMISPLWQRTSEHEMLSRELNKVRIDAQEVSKLREDLERARLGSVEVLQRKLEQPRMTDLLRELTDLLPDDTWVQTLNVRDGSVDIRGESNQATALISFLEKGPGISNVSFRSPVMQVGASGTERYHISFDYQRPAPQ